MKAYARFRTSAFTLVEVVVSTACLAIGITALCASFISAMQLDDVSQQAAIATQRARQELEGVPLENFSTLFARHNADAADDPGGAGTAPGSKYPSLNTFWANQRYSNHPGSSFPVVGMKSLPFDVPGFGTATAIGRLEFHNYDARHSLHEIHVRIVWKGPSERSDPSEPPDGTTFVELVTLVSQRMP